MDESRVDEECGVGVGVGVDLGNPKEEEEVGNLSICSVGPMSRSFKTAEQLSGPKFTGVTRYTLSLNLKAGVDFQIQRTWKNPPEKDRCTPRPPKVQCREESLRHFLFLQAYIPTT